MRQWKLASPFGILREDDAADPEPAWNAGRLKDALRLNLPSYDPPNPLLIASETSGVWIVNEKGDPAIPLGRDWEAPGVNCLARGFYDEAHVFVGGGALYETDMTKPDPLRAWRRIALVDATDLPVNTGEIFRIVIAPYHSLHIVEPWRRAIVLATQTGVWWSALPSTPGPLAHLVVTKAVFLPGALAVPFPDAPFTGLALNADDQVVAACWGSDFEQAYGIFVGGWTGPGSSLEFTTRAAIHGIDPRQMLRTELAAAPRRRNHMYAVCGGGFTKPARDEDGHTILDGVGQGGIKWDGDDFILAVLHSADGGHSWAPTSTIVNNGIAPLGGDPPALFPGSPTEDLAGHTQEGRNLCVGVSPFHHDVLAIGVINVFLSQDGGQTWDAYPSGTSRHRHADTHACYFDPLTQGTLHVCSDGGLATTPDMGTTWSSTANRQLPNLQCRRFSVSASVDGLLAGSLQDNGDVVAPLYPDADPWRILPADGGDGILSLFVSTGALVHHNNSELSHRSRGYKPRAAVWDGVGRRFADLHMFPPVSQLWYGVIPVDGMFDGLTSNVEAVYHGVGWTKRRAYLNLVEAVTTPTGANEDGEVMLAVAAEGTEVHGLYPKADGTFHWQLLWLVPYRPSIDPASPTDEMLPYYATASASLDGNSVLVGMSTGKLFRLDRPSAPAMWTTATELSNPAIPVTEAITRIVPVAADSLFVIAGAGCYHWNGASWKTLAVPSAGHHLEALAADSSTAPNPPRLFIATTSGVWKSEDSGATWDLDMLDLPRVPMAWDLRTVKESSGAAFVYLATYGWSVFRRLTNTEDVQQQLTIAGKMDIVSRTVTSDDITGHPPFNRTATLGPLHPKAEWTITGDAGTAVRVLLNLKCAWRFDDLSIHVTYHAELIDLDDDNEVTGFEDGEVPVPFGATVPLAFSMDSDELWPDRGYVECTIANL